MSRLSRRGFLAGASAAIASAPALANLASRAAAPGFLLGCQTYTFREFDLEGALKRMKELGIQHAEFYQKHLPLGATGRQLEAFQKLCADYGVSPRAWGVQRFSKDHDANRKVFDFAKGAGLKVLTADPIRTASTAWTSAARSTASRWRFIRTGPWVAANCTAGMTRTRFWRR